MARVRAPAGVGVLWFRVLVGVPVRDVDRIEAASPLNVRELAPESRPDVPTVLESTLARSE